MEFFTDYGLVGLFLSAFFAATILPFSSEALLVFLVEQRGDWLLPLLFASAGNVLGSVVNYYLGFYGDKFIFFKIFRMKESTVQKAKSRYRKYGVFSLLLAWLPIVGDPITVAAGAFRVNIFLFALLVSVGKIARYSFLILALSALS